MKKLFFCAILLFVNSVYSQVSVVPFSYWGTNLTEGGRVYYLSSAGSDSNSGLDSTEAFLTIDKLESVGLLSGDTVRFRGGDTVKGSASFSSINFSDVTKKIVFNSYGSGKSYLKNDTNDVVFLFDFIDIVRLEFKNLIFQGIYNPLTQTGGAIDSKAIWINNSDHHAGIAGDSMYVAIDSCEFYNYWHSAIYLYIMSSTKRGTYNITNNIIKDNGLTGINIWGIFYSNLNIVGNDVRNIYSRDDDTWVKGFGGIFSYFTRNANIAYNYIGNIGQLTPVGSSGCHFTYSKNIHMRHNVVDKVYTSPTGGEGVGLYVDCGSDSAIFENNFVQNCQGSGIILANAPTSLCGLYNFFPGFTEDSLESSFNIARFNIIIGDSVARGGIQMYAKYQSAPNTIHRQKRNMIYNNLIFMKGGYAHIDTATGQRLPAGIWQYGWSDSLYIFNNIFVMDSALAIQHDIPAGFGYPGTAFADITNWVVTNNLYWQLNGLDNSIARQRINSFNNPPFYFRYRTYQSISNWNDSTNFNPVYYNENPLINNLTTDYGYRNPYHLDTLFSFLYSNNIVGTNFNSEVIRIADTLTTDFYGLPIVDRIGPFQGSIVDSNFSIAWSERPVNFQLFAKESNDSGDVLISGTVTNTEDYFDTCLTQLYRNGSLVKTTYQNLSYTGYNANFSITNRIKAEPAEYRVVLSLRSLSNKDSVIYTADSLVAGLVFVLQGQSNIQYSRRSSNLMDFTNEYMRTFGIQTDSFNQKPYTAGDTLWHRTYSYCALDTVAGGDYYPYNVGAIGQFLQKYILDSFAIPTAVINGALLNTSIKTHTRNNSDPDDLSTLYGKLLYRLQKSGLANSIAAYIFYQGESDMAYAVDNPSPTAYYMNPRGLTDAINYPIYFDSLFKSWVVDTDFKKIYVLQMRHNYTYQFHQSRFRERQRQLDSIYHDTVQVIPTLGIGGRNADMTHFDIAGYQQLAQNIFRRLRQDFFTITDSVDMRAPSIKKAFYTTIYKTSIGMTFRGSNPNSIPSDSLSNNIKNSFYLDGVRMSSSTSLTLSSNKDTLYLNLPSANTATYISYLPRGSFDATDIPIQANIYNGPVIRNSKGIAVLAFDSIHIWDAAPPDTNLWQQETKDWRDRALDSGSTVTVNDTWTVDSLVVKLKNDNIWTGWDALFVAGRDTIAMKTDFMTSDSNYTFWGGGYSNIDPDIPTYTSFLGYENAKADSVWLRSNIIPSRLYYFKKDSGTTTGWSGDQFTADSYINAAIHNGIGKLWGVWDSTSTIHRSLNLQPFGNYTGFGLQIVNTGQVPTSTTALTMYYPGSGSSTTPKGLFTLAHQERGTPDSVYFMRNDTVRQQVGGSHTFYDINYPLYFNAMNIQNVAVTTFSQSRFVAFAIGKRWTIPQMRLFYTHLAWYLTRTGGI